MPDVVYPRQENDDVRLFRQTAVQARRDIENAVARNAPVYEYELCIFIKRRKFFRKQRDIAGAEAGGIVSVAAGVGDGVPDKQNFHFTPSIIFL